MGWARGLDANGREVGYGITAVCDEPGCAAVIDRGLAWRCGPLGSETDDPAIPGCGRYFCGDHLFGSDVASARGGGGFCNRCVDALEADARERAQTEPTS